MYMKLINLNVELDEHITRALPFIDREQPDVLCLQEASDSYSTALFDRGYTVTKIAHVLKQTPDGEILTDYDMIATKSPHTAKCQYYYKPEGDLQFEDINNKRKTNRQGLVVATFRHHETDFTVATTHFTWTPEGAVPNAAQLSDMEEFLKIVETLPPHIMCGDFNIPRHHNPLYERLTAVYTDNIPQEYTSSMDKNLHRLGSDPHKENLFTDFMVDYIFTKPPYVTKNVRLEFGVSDHAAVVCEVAKE
jgi:endonuclease/exonuclease/phosphatase family metal-dependent hydrolase